jgi:maltose alpha-D-glucosyltransferase / alpha-amylase
VIEDLWYKNSIIYSLDLETFMDGNGDGVGDFAGLIRRLDYLVTLGVDVIWLAPFHPSPNRDNGYDVSDYYGVDPRHGSPGEFVEFVHQAKKRGLKVIIDLVVNHTSDRHPWFQEARKNPDSPVRDWYVWSKKKPETWNEGMVFPGMQDRTWTYDSAAGAWYFHRFFEHQPDLNVDNPEVRTEIRRIIGFWLQAGVDGFRVDAVPFIIERPALEKGKKPVLTFEYLEEFREFLQWRAGDAVLLGEANVVPKETAKYFADGRGIHMMFNFWVNQRLFYSLASGEVEPLAKALEETRELPPTAQWANFLRNHDELDIDRLPDDQKEKVFARFGPEERMQLFHRGIRRRLAPMLGNRQMMELAYSMLFSLPGTPVMRYGDEIGMGENLDLHERDAVRTPMQWSRRDGGGFSSGTRLVHPIIDEGVYAYQHVNVDDQKRDPDSFLRWTVRMVRLRKDCPEVGWGEWKIVETGSESVLALLYTWRGNSLLTLHNFSDHACDVTMKIDEKGGEQLVNLLTSADSRAGDRRRHNIALEAFGYRWFRVGEFDHHITRRAEEPGDVTPAGKGKKKKG